MEKEQSRIKLGILKAFAGEEEKYARACEHLNVPFEIIDILAPDWIERVNASGCKGFLAYPPDNIQEQKNLMDERLYFLEKVMKKPLYPGFESLYLYENKRNMAYWLQLNDIPHPATNIFCRKKDAISFLKSARYPLVFKTNIGAGASGIDIIKKRSKALRITRRIFGSMHPSVTTGRTRFSDKYMIPVPLFGRTQKHYLIVQEFIPIKWEWRIIKIGNSYFGHQKLLKGQFASGSGKVGWVEPPKELLLLTKHICELGNFHSMAVDIFETLSGDFLVNELQAIFGSYLPYQMKIDEKPGRFLFQNNDFVFEPGEFNQFSSNILRVSDFIRILREDQH